MTNLCYFGDFGLNYLFQMFYLVRHFRYLEESSFLGKPGDFFWMLFIGTLLISVFIKNYCYYLDFRIF